MTIMHFDAIAVTSEGETLDALLAAYSDKLQAAGFEVRTSRPRLNLSWPSENVTQDRCRISVDVSRRGSRQHAMRAVNAVKPGRYSFSR